MIWPYMTYRYPWWFSIYYVYTSNDAQWTYLYTSICLKHMAKAWISCGKEHGWRWHISCGIIDGESHQEVHTWGNDKMGSSKKKIITRRYKRHIQLNGINDMTPQWYYWLGGRRTRQRCVSTCSGLSLLSTTTRGCRGPLPRGPWPPMEDDFWSVSGRIDRYLGWVTVVCNYIYI